MSTLTAHAVRNIKLDLRIAKKIRPPWWAVIALGLIFFFIWSAAIEFGILGIIRAIVFFAIAVSFTVAIKWQLRRNGWFWVTMGVIVALHVPLMILIPWSANWIPSLAIIATCTADILIMLFIINIVGLLRNADNHAPTYVNVNDDRNR